MITRDQILQSEETAKLVNEFLKPPFVTTTWKEFVETKLNEGKFKTEDGVMVGTGGNVYAVEKTKFIITDLPVIYPKSLKDSWLYFSTPDARQTWIEENKPMLSKKEVVEAFNNWKVAITFEELISDLVKSKL
jgi:hypothetical protein